MSHGQLVGRTIAIWVLVHVLLVAVLGGSGYVQCRGSAPSTGAGCGVGLGLVTLAIGWIQAVYGLLAALILTRRGRTAIGQGLVIASSVLALVFTGVCFAAAAFG
jgi:hypothetical protein